MRISRQLAATALVAAVLAFPLGVLASHEFTDVPTSNIFHSDIDAIADVGVTTGCGPARYCPKDFVTREQMAAFLNRLGALGPDKTPVVNADKVDGIDEVMPGGDLVTMQLGPWVPTVGFPGTINPTATSDRFDIGGATTGQPRVALTSPASIGGQAYGLKSARICYGASTNATIATTLIGESVNAVASFKVNDPTDRSMVSGNCYTVTDPTPEALQGGAFVLLEIQFSAAGSAFLGTVTATWTPV